MGYNVHPYWELGSQNAQGPTICHLSFRSFSARRVGKRKRGRGHLSTTLATSTLCRLSLVISVGQQIRKWPKRACYMLGTSPLYPCAKPLR